MPPDSTHSGPNLIAALALLQGGDVAGAFEMNRLLLELMPGEPAVHQLAATIALRREDAEAAKRFAETALDLRPDHVPTLLLAGHAARAAGNSAQALLRFRQAMQRAPERAEAAFMTCIALLEQSDGEAQTLLAHCLDKFPGDAGGWQAIGTALLKAEQPEAALVAFTRAARIVPTCALHLQRGAILRSLDKFAEAAEAFQAAQVMAPQNFDAALNLGLCLHRLGDLAKARTALTQATGLNPRAERAWFALGLVAQDEQDWTTAIAAYRNALATAPHLAEAAVNLGIVLQENGDLAAARQAYGQALHLRADTFGRIAQALTTAPRGELWLDLAALRRSLKI